MATTALVLLATGCMKSPPASRQPTHRSSATPPTLDPAAKDWGAISESEWKKRLLPEQFYVTRQRGTERPFSGEYWDATRAGTYHCICCDAPLFDSTTKFRSNTGWPSFWEPIAPGAVDNREDLGLGVSRTEVVCHRCGAHLGHVFPDGPAPTGQRYCMNSVALILRDHPSIAPDE